MSEISIEQVCDVLENAGETAKLAVDYAREVENRAQEASAKSAQNDNVYLQKVAFDEDALSETLDKLERYNLIDRQGRQKIASEVSEDPNKILPILAKVAEVNAVPHSEGSGVAKQASAGNKDSDADPDGWFAFANGEPVEIK